MFIVSFSVMTANVFGFCIGWVLEHKPLGFEFCTSARLRQNRYQPFVVYFQSLFSFFSFNSCLIDVKCPNNTIGTIKVGNQLNGKFKIAILGWSKANFWIGEGAENNAFTTIFIRNPRQMKFQIRIVCLFSFDLVSPKYAITGAEIPARMSKLRPVKVISSGIVLLRKSQNKIISTGILTMFRYVKFLRGKLSIKYLPFEVVNNTIIVKIVGKIPINIIFGGKEFVSNLYMLCRVKIA